ncbi:deleted in malignant brain tumors 1 protein [Elysia marginata]|uniref:Deleted in malignant brain tumors 1 protein n=1 Tax=Elysia marginata TaxID=1093978 RepID=A0AAV4EWF9_9GAST|nr:deleted in malignant brain tumors 1 protein [Elysia marginata]
MDRHWCVIYILLLVCVVEVISKRKYKEGDVKLVGGQKRYMGTVLVRYNNRWGAICDGGWDKKDAHVVCNQLGFYAAASAPRGSKFGIGRSK